MDVSGLFCTANERIAEQARAIAYEGEIPFLCECDDSTCFAIVRITAAGFVDARASGVEVAVPEHRSES